jgi:hypothetical protein
MMAIMTGMCSGACMDSTSRVDRRRQVVNWSRDGAEGYTSSLKDCMMGERREAALIDFLSGDPTSPPRDEVSSKPCCCSQHRTRPPTLDIPEYERGGQNTVDSAINQRCGYRKMMCYK